MALSLPEVREDHPWGHSAFKVGKKAFLFMASENGGLSLSVKLPQSGLLALSLPFAQPTGYGLGKSGWVTASFTPKQSPPVPVLSAGSRRATARSRRRSWSRGWTRPQG